MLSLPHPHWMPASIMQVWGMSLSQRGWRPGGLSSIQRGGWMGGTTYGFFLSSCTKSCNLEWQHVCRGGADQMEAFVLLAGNKKSRAVWAAVHAAVIFAHVFCHVSVCVCVYVLDDKLCVSCVHSSVCFAMPVSVHASVTCICVPCTHWPVLYTCMPACVCFYVCKYMCAY